MNNRKLTVCKFGGSSLANARNIDRVANIIASHPSRKGVVVSAPGKRDVGDTKITDLLIRLYEMKSRGEDFRGLFDVIADRFIEIERSLGLSPEIQGSLEKFAVNIAELDYNRDMIESAGEYFMARILARYLGFEFVDIKKTGAISLDSEGHPDISASKACFFDIKGNGVVVPGFYGCMPNGSIKTLSRGGSDITGAVVSNITDADIYENWTDVSGVYDCDPNKYSHAKPFSKISYGEVEALARSGANVLHPNCIDYVRLKNIPINIRNTFSPKDCGTMIVPD